MRIREEQITALLDAARQRLADRIQRELLQEHAETMEKLSPESITERIGTSMLLADTFGLHEDRDVTAFVTLTFVISSRFYEFPLFRDILQDPLLPPRSKLSTLFAAAQGSDWEQAAALA